MRIKVLAFAALFLLISNSSSGIPQTPTAPTSSPQAASLLTQSFKALSGSGAVSDATLTGTVEWIAGSDGGSRLVEYSPYLCWARDAECCVRHPRERL